MEKVNRAKAWHGGKWIRRERRLGINIRDGFMCLYCGADLRAYDPTSVTLDHLEARVYGGTNRNNNLITACKSCNSRRGCKDWREYAPGGAIERIQAAVLQPVNIKLAKAIIAGDVGDPRIEARR